MRGKPNMVGLDWFAARHRHRGITATALWLLAALLPWPVFAGVGNLVAVSSEPLVSRLEFRIADVPPGRGPVRSFRYSCEFHSASTGGAAKQSADRRNVAYSAKDGILRIAQPFPPYGRVAISVDADDPQNGYRCSFDVFSYCVDPSKPFEPPVVRLEPGIVLTGTAVDAETGKPISDAEVAPLKGSAQACWADWDEAARTDRDGRYRITTTEAQGIEARHGDYGPRKLEAEGAGFEPGTNRLGDAPIEEPKDSKARGRAAKLSVGPEGIIVRMPRAITLHGRVADPVGKPIAGATVSREAAEYDCECDAQGRFGMKFTKLEWLDREGKSVQVSADGYRSRDVPLMDLSPDQERSVVLQPTPIVRGQVFDERGQAPEDCRVELQRECDAITSKFSAVAGPSKEGKWESHIDDDVTAVTVRVSVAGVARSLKRYTIEEATGGPIVTRLSAGHLLSGRLVARVPLGDGNTPTVALEREKSGDRDPAAGPVGQARVAADGSFAFRGLADGKYTLRLYPAHAAQPPSADALSLPAVSERGGDETAAPTKPWQRPVVIHGGDVRLEAIDLHAAGLLPGRLTMLAFQPTSNPLPFANAFVSLSGSESDIDPLGVQLSESDSSGRFVPSDAPPNARLGGMTDAGGRFGLEPCQPGKYVLRLTYWPGGRWTPAVWVRVAPEKTADVRLFAPERRLKIKFAVGDGSARDVYAAAAVDADAPPQKGGGKGDGKGRPWAPIRDDSKRSRAIVTAITFELEPRDESIGYWPIYHETFAFEPRALLKQRPQDVVIPNVAPGRWRLKLKSSGESQTMLTRDFTFAEGMGALRVEVLPAALVGTIESAPPGLVGPGPGGFEKFTVVAVGTAAGLPTRTCTTDDVFRFIGLPPGKYSLRVSTKYQTFQPVEARVEKGKTTWLGPVYLAPVNTKPRRAFPPEPAPAPARPMAISASSVLHRGSTPCASRPKKRPSSR
jgi:protocatechuate 3,4-dioxygenase beta subunit